MKWKNKILKGIVQENMSDGNEGFSSDDENQVYTRTVNSRNTNKTPGDVDSHPSMSENSKGRIRHKRGKPFGK